MNKTTSIIIDSVLAIAVVVLFVLHFCGGKCCHSQEAAPALAEGDATVMPIAYINLDTLLVQYTFAIEASDKLMAKQEDARAKFNAKMRTFQNEYADFQRKLENNAFLSRERAENEANRLQRKQAELEELEQKLSQEIMIETQNLNIEMADSLQNYLADYNADGHLHMILTNTGKDNVLMADPIYDITSVVVAGMNARYDATAKKTKK